MNHSNEPTRVAVIGCGAIANEHLSFLAKSPLVRLIGVCDTAKATAAFAKARFHADEWFIDANDMLARTRPEVVHVLTPPQSHMGLVSRCLNADSHVICEKPMTPSAPETLELLALAEAKGKFLFESRNLLFNDSVLKIDKLVSNGTLGLVREVDVLLSLDLTAGPFGDLNLGGPGVALPGGAVHDFLPHLAYLFLHYAKHSQPVDQVSGILENQSGNARVGYDHLDVHISAGLCRGRLRIASDLKPDMFRLILRGSNAVVETDLYNPFMRLQTSKDSGKRAPLEQVMSGLGLFRAGFANLRDKVLQHGAYHGLPRMLSAFYEGLRAGEEMPFRASDIAATALLVDRVIQVRRGV